MKIFPLSVIALIAATSTTTEGSFIASVNGRSSRNRKLALRSAAQDDSFSSQTRDAEILRVGAAAPQSGTNLVKSAWTPPQGEAFKQDIFPNVPKLITIDATDTLIQLKSEVGLIYRNILHEATRFRARLPTPAVFTTAFNTAFVEIDQEYPCYGCGLGMTSREWWYLVSKKTFDYVEHLDYEPGLRRRLQGDLGDAVCEVLYNSVFMGTEAWELKPGVLEALSRFKMWRDEGGPVLAVLANHDERLHQVLENLGIADAFDFILTSREIGSAKPSRSAFEVAMSRASVSEASLCMHIGDGFSTDVIGAANAGWHSVWIPHINKDDIPSNIDPDLIFSRSGDLFAVLDMFGLDPYFRLIPMTRYNDERGNFMDEVRVYTDEDFEDDGGRLELPAAPKSWEGPGRL